MTVTDLVAFRVEEQRESLSLSASMDPGMVEITWSKSHSARSPLFPVLFVVNSTYGPHVSVNGFERFNDRSSPSNLQVRSQDATGCSHL